MTDRIIGFLFDTFAVLLFFKSVGKSRRKAFWIASSTLLLTIPIYLFRSVSGIIVLSFAIRVVTYSIFSMAGTDQSSRNSVFTALVFTNLLTSLQTIRPFLGRFSAHFWNNHLVGTIVYYLILVLMFFLISKHLHMDELGEVKPFLMATIGIISIILIYSKTVVQQEGLQNYDQNLYPVAVMLLSVSTMVIIIRMTILAENRRQSEIMGIKQKEQINSLKAEIETAEAFKQIAHDMKNHLIVLKNNLNSDSSAHIDTIISQIDAYRSSIQTGNECMDSLLSAKMPIIQSSGIRLTVSMDLSPVSYLTEFDVISVFGNALDNAIEASLSVPTESRYITIRTSFYAGKFFISFVNGCSDRTDVSMNTTKNEKNLHGIGLKSIRRTVTQYNGEVSAQYSMPGEFTLSIMLPVR